MNAQLEEAYVAGVMAKLAEYGLEGLEKDAQFWAGLKGGLDGIRTRGAGGFTEGRQNAKDHSNALRDARRELAKRQREMARGARGVSRSAPFEKLVDRLSVLFGGTSGMDKALTDGEQARKALLAGQESAVQRMLDNISVLEGTSPSAYRKPPDIKITSDGKYK